MTKQTELPWVAEARKYLNLKELPGKQHNPYNHQLVSWTESLVARRRDSMVWNIRWPLHQSRRAPSAKRVVSCEGLG